ncbi:hypothetical protein [Novosphingobium beihaiensis]|uniref:Vitamin K epoxide reductase family protein n=1 Tax=Novosphingobium beihaiensis TaxID=2930389 RepID=A0ABT0BTL6_9SPHN|nr:hypothetical protein [Novosphingobium beihaiensis]MCJ2188381.1 hypothetical protein [Novosphingobium beihaiensis]
MHDPSETKTLPAWKTLVVLACAVLGLVGIFDAVTNLPVVSGCAFYSHCDEGAFRNPPGAMGRDVP